MNVGRGAVGVIGLWILGMILWPAVILASEQEPVTTIRIEAGNRASGERIAVFQIARWNGVTGEYLWEAAYEPAEEALEEEGTEAGISCLSDLTKNQEADLWISLDAEGEASLEMPAGLYFLRQAEEARGKMQPVLIGLPRTDETGEGWEKEAVLYPKYAPPAENPKTGDTRLLLWTGIFILSLLGLAGVWVAGRGRKKV